MTDEAQQDDQLLANEPVVPHRNRHIGASTPRWHLPGGEIHDGG